VIVTASRLHIAFDSRRICDVPARRRWITCSGEAVRRSTIRHFAVLIWSAADATRDDVERNRDGQSAAAMHRASRRLQPSPGLALLSRFHQPRLAFVRVYPYDRPPRILNRHPMTPNIYYQRQPCLTNNSQAFTECGTHAQGRCAATTEMR
jgi:hypothetical protein